MPYRFFFAPTFHPHNFNKDKKELNSFPLLGYCGHSHTVETCIGQLTVVNTPITGPEQQPLLISNVYAYDISSVLFSVIRMEKAEP